MFFPVIPILSSVCTALGIYGLVWYHQLSKSEREEADRLASKYARDIYNKGVNELTKAQLSHVNDLVKGHFTN